MVEAEFPFEVARRLASAFEAAWPLLRGPVMPERRDLRPEEMAVIAELAMATPDLVAAKDRILAALVVAQAPPQAAAS